MALIIPSAPIEAIPAGGALALGRCTSMSLAEMSTAHLYSFGGLAAVLQGYLRVCSSYGDVALGHRSSFFKGSCRKRYKWGSAIHPVDVKSRGGDL